MLYFCWLKWRCLHEDWLPSTVLTHIFRTIAYKRLFGPTGSRHTSLGTFPYPIFIYRNLSTDCRIATPVEDLVADTEGGKYLFFPGK